MNQVSRGNFFPLIGNAQCNANGLTGAPLVPRITSCPAISTTAEKQTLTPATRQDLSLANVIAMAQKINPRDKFLLGSSSMSFLVLYTNISRVLCIEEQLTPGRKGHLRICRPQHYSLHNSDITRQSDKLINLTS